MHLLLTSLDFTHPARDVYSELLSHHVWCSIAVSGRHCCMFVNKCWSRSRVSAAKYTEHIGRRFHGWKSKGRDFPVFGAEKNPHNQVSYRAYSDIWKVCGAKKSPQHNQVSYRAYSDIWKVFGAEKSPQHNQVSYRAYSDIWKVQFMVPESVYWKQSGHLGRHFSNSGIATEYDKHYPERQRVKDTSIAESVSSKEEEVTGRGTPKTKTLDLKVQTGKDTGSCKGTVKMLSIDEVYRSTVVPSRTSHVDVTLDSVHSTPPRPYPVTISESSEIEVDTTVNLKVLSDGDGSSFGDSERWSSSGSLSHLLSESTTEVKTHPRRYKPLLGGEQRRRRTMSDPSGLLSRPPRQNSLSEFRNDMHHAATETYLISRLTLTLLRYLGLGYRWIIKFAALALYALFLMPGFIQVGFYYYFSKCVHRSIVYGTNPATGNKAWGSLLGQQMVDRGIIVACIDYRNFPQGCISDMVSDVSTGIGYVCNNIAHFGGDPDSMCTGDAAKRELVEDATLAPWRTSQFKAFLGISGGYNLLKLVDHFHHRGLYRSIFLSVMEGEASLPLFSPELLVRSPAFQQAAPLLPPITLFHGTADNSIPYDASVTFGDALRSVGVTVTTHLYPDKTHTDLFLQDPMRGGRDQLMSDILAVVHADDEEAKAEDAVAMMGRRLVPEFLLQLARKVSPF